VCVGGGSGGGGGGRGGEMMVVSKGEHSSYRQCGATWEEAQYVNDDPSLAGRLRL
jgi:hypothetical protein